MVSRPKYLRPIAANIEPDRWQCFMVVLWNVRIEHEINVNNNKNRLRLRALTLHFTFRITCLLARPDSAISQCKQISVNFGGFCCRRRKFWGFRVLFTAETLFEKSVFWRENCFQASKPQKISPAVAMSFRRTFCVEILHGKYSVGLCWYRFG